MLSSANRATASLHLKLIPKICSFYLGREREPTHAAHGSWGIPAGERAGGALALEEPPQIKNKEQEEHTHTHHTPVGKAADIWN